MIKLYRYCFIRTYSTPRKTITCSPPFLDQLSVVLTAINLAVRLSSASAATDSGQRLGKAAPIAENGGTS
jgi:hypothetical protein